MQKLMKHLHKNEKGFTLVELMVVVVIIGILIAIAIPIYNTVQETARQNALDATVRTINGQWMIYTAEDDLGEAADWPGNYLVGFSGTDAQINTADWPNNSFVRSGQQWSAE